jgi:ribonuclease J
MVLALFSAQNIDRLVTLYRAALQASRDMVVDLYTARIAVATGNPNIPQPGFDRLRVFVPQRQRVQVKRSGKFEMVESIRGCRIFPEELSEERSRLVMTFRMSMAEDLERAGCLEGARAVWSLWSGYLEEESGRELLRFLDGHGISLETLHTSGHAGLEDMQRLMEAIKPGCVVPIHSEAAFRFKEFFERVHPKNDGEWWKV